MACKCRKIFKLICVPAAVLALIFLAAGPIIASVVRKTASGVFYKAQVDIKSCRLWPPGSCVLSGIEIKRNAAYRISVKTISVRIRPSLIPGKLLSGVFIKGVKISLNAPAARIADLPAYLSKRQGKGRMFVPERIRAEDLSLDVNTKDLIMGAQGSFELDARSSEFRHILLNVGHLEFSGIRVLNASIQADAQRTGSLYIEKINAGKLVVSDIKARALLAGRDLMLEDLSAAALGGRISAGFRITLAGDIPYEASIAAADLDLAAFVRDFGLKEKLELSGLVSGVFNARGSSAGSKFLSGDLKGADPGGFLNIRDQSMIDTIAERSGQARDLISRSFTDYRYESVMAGLNTRDNKLILDVAFQGSQGKRILKAILHDFTVKGGDE